MSSEQHRRTRAREKVTLEPIISRVFTRGRRPYLKITFILDLCLRKTRAGKSNDNRDVNVFEKRRYLDGLVWTVGLAIEIKLRFQCERGLISHDNHVGDLSFAGDQLCTS